MKKSLYVFGDLHISDKEYHVYGINQLMKWMEANLKEGQTVLFLGDILTAISANIIAVQQLIALSRLLDKMKMEKIVMMGNHDYGMLNRRLKDGADIYQELGFKVIADTTEMEINGMKSLLIPWKRSTEKEVTKELEKYAGKEFDLLFGHWAYTVSKFIPNIDISKISAKHISFGHLHKHCDGDNYIGAPVPNNVDEFPTNASCNEYYVENDKVVKVEHKLPEFVKLTKIVVEKGKVDSVKKNLTETKGNYYYLIVNSIQDYSLAKGLKLEMPSILGIKLNNQEDNSLENMIVGSDAFFSKVASLSDLYKQLLEQKVINDEEFAILNKHYKTLN